MKMEIGKQSKKVYKCDCCQTEWSQEEGNLQHLEDPKLNLEILVCYDCIHYYFDLAGCLEVGKIVEGRVAESG